MGIWKYLNIFVLLISVYGGYEYVMGYLTQEKYARAETLMKEQEIGPWTVAVRPIEEWTSGNNVFYEIQFCAECQWAFPFLYVRVGPPSPELGEFVPLIYGPYSFEVSVTQPVRIMKEDQLWLTIKGWDNQLYTASWPLMIRGDS